MKHAPSATEARISEIFSSLQGEGTHAGERHLFVRFEECHIHCVYCDELHKKGTVKSLDEVIQEIEDLERDEGPHRFVSLTGGEPLLYLQFIKPLIKKMKATGHKIYLETDGILWKALEEVVGWCDVIAMDMKPASVTKERCFDEEHGKFLRIARGKECFVKMVVSRELKISEFESHVRIIAGQDASIPLVLMPVSGAAEGHEDPELMKLLYELQSLAARQLDDVRIVPRLHRILNIR